LYEANVVGIHRRRSIGAKGDPQLSGWPRDQPARGDGRIPRRHGGLSGAGVAGELGLVDDENVGEWEE